MKRRRWTPEQKALIVLEGLKGRSIGELCAEHPPPAYKDDRCEWPKTVCKKCIRPHRGVFTSGHDGNPRAPTS